MWIILWFRVIKCNIDLWRSKNVFHSWRRRFFNELKEDMVLNAVLEILTLHLPTLSLATITSCLYCTFVSKCIRLMETLFFPLSIFIRPRTMEMISSPGICCFHVLSAFCLSVCRHSSVLIKCLLSGTVMRVSRPLAHPRWKVYYCCKCTVSMKRGITLNRASIQNALSEEEMQMNKQEGWRGTGDGPVSGQQLLPLGRLLILSPVRENKHLSRVRF